MEKQLILELATMQEKARAIDRLSNCIQHLTAKEGKEVAYLIHRIIESDTFNSDLARSVTSWNLQAHKDLFQTV